MSIPFIKSGIPKCPTEYELMPSSFETPEVRKKRLDQELSKLLKSKYTLEEISLPSSMQESSENRKERIDKELDIFKKMRAEAKEKEPLNVEPLVERTTDLSSSDDSTPSDPIPRNNAEDDMSIYLPVKRSSSTPSAHADSEKKSIPRISTESDISKRSTSEESLRIAVLKKSPLSKLASTSKSKLQELFKK